MNRLLSFRYVFLGWLKLAEENNSVIFAQCTCMHRTLFRDLFVYLLITELWNIFRRLPWRLGLDGSLVSLTVAVSMARCCSDTSSLEEGRRPSSFWASALSYVDQCMRLLWFTQNVCDEPRNVPFSPPYFCLLVLAFFVCICCNYYQTLTTVGRKGKKSRIIRELIANMRGNQLIQMAISGRLCFWPVWPASVAHI